MSGQATLHSSSLAFENATIVTLRGNEVLPDHTLIVSDQRIAAIAPSHQIAAPANSLKIDMRGRYLIPGLADMHAHITPTGFGPGHDVPDELTALERAADFLRVLLAHGVTTVRNMAGTPFHLRVRQAVRDGTMAGPRIHTAGPILESRFTFPGLARFGELVRSREEARAAVLAHQHAGYDCIKVYNDIDAEIYDEIIATCREVGLKVVGHVAFSKGLEGALDARQDSIEHFRSYDFALDTRPGHRVRFEGWLHTSKSRIREVAERTAAAGTWNVPTLVVERAIAEDSESSKLPPWLPAWLVDELVTDDTRTLFSPAVIDTIRAGSEQRLELLAALDAAGAPIMAGSDCPACALVPGQSLQDELALYVQAGLSPLRALRSATIDAATFLGMNAVLGTLEVGKFADMVALDADPVHCIDALRRIHGVVAAGNWHPRSALTAAHL